MHRSESKASDSAEHQPCRRPRPWTPQSRHLGTPWPHLRTSVGFTGAPCLSSKGAGHQNVRSHPRMLGPSVFADSRVVPECLVLQYFQIHESHHNAWSFSISRFTGHTRMLGPLMPKSTSSDTQHKQYKFRHPKYKFRHPKYKFRHPKYSGISSDTKNIA